MQRTAPGWRSLLAKFADYPDSTYKVAVLKGSQPMVTITAADLQKQFGRYREIALREPVSVTHHGRESLVMMSAHEYNRLKSFDDRKAYYTWELPEDLAEALENVEIPPDGDEFNNEYKP